MSADDSSASTSFTTHDFFSPSAFATLAGATAGVVIVTNTLTGIVGETPQWLPFGIAMASSLGAYSYAATRKPSKLAKTPRLLRYALVVLNGCLIYTSAFGVQGVVANDTGDSSSAATVTATSKVFDSWTSILQIRKSKPRQRTRASDVHGDAQASVQRSS